MLIDTYTTIAYKCSSCGSFVFFNISVFNLVKNRECSYKCRCGKSVVILDREKARVFRLITSCIGCGGKHAYIVNLRDILDQDIHAFHCPVTGLAQCFIGSDRMVRERVDCLEQELDELIDMFGYDSYFKNTQVMFDALNKIHDIAEQGGLYCECGSSDIELMLLPDRICLKCRRCTGSKEVEAASNEDLKNILVKHCIILVGENEKPIKVDKRLI